MATKKNSRSVGRPGPRARAESFPRQLRRMKALLAAGRGSPDTRRPRVGRKSLRSPATGPAAASGGSVTVPRANVGAAVQAAVSFEAAIRVLATAVNGTSDYLVTWN